MKSALVKLEKLKQNILTLQNSGHFLKSFIVDVSTFENSVYSCILYKRLFIWIGLDNDESYQSQFWLVSFLFFRLVLILLETTKSFLHNAGNHTANEITYKMQLKACSSCYINSMVVAFWEGTYMLLLFELWIEIQFYWKHKNFL